MATLSDFNEMITKKVRIGKSYIGGGESVKIQSMCTVKTSETDDAVRQILSLENAGCEIIRVSVLDEADAKAIKNIKDKIPTWRELFFRADTPTKRVLVNKLIERIDITGEQIAVRLRVSPGNLMPQSRMTGDGVVPQQGV